VCKNWRAPKSWDEVCRRAAGRRRYNAERQVGVMVRRWRVLELVKQTGLVSGAQRRMAKELGVSEATISRDIDAMLPLAMFCPCCMSLVAREGWPLMLAEALDAGGHDLTQSRRRRRRR
jgi:hypothetical protein